MKKILLMIAIAFCIFQMVVLAVDIDIGSPAIYREDTLHGANVHIVKDNPANASGKITSVEIYSNNTLTDCEVATFYEGASNYFSTRDWEYIGTVTAGAKRTFPVDLDVEAGDYIGIYVDNDISPCLDYTGYLGYWYAIGCDIPCSDVLFSFWDDYTASVYGTGIGPWPHKWNTITIGKWNTKEIMKWNELE